jgi:hypothetical protein
MLKAIFTLDYEIHGNGDGCPYALMVEPTERMLRLFEEYDAKLTIMADIAEILKFREHAEKCGRDDYHYRAIATQLQDAIRRGHDVQLHVHASYFNARHEQGRWLQDWSEYDFAGLGPNRIKEIVRLGKDFLESLLQPVDSSYKCQVFRAANWAVSPSRNVVRGLVENGFKVDTSVFKYGQREGLVRFDYGNAWSNLVPWRVDENDICACSDHGRLLEFPIYSESRWLGAFLTPGRIYRVCVSRLHRFKVGQDGAPPDVSARADLRPGGRGATSWLMSRHAWKADFNQCTGRELIAALLRAEREHRSAELDLPFVLIGHSKLFTRFNEWNLRPFLAYVAKHPGRFGFGRFADFDLESRLSRSAGLQCARPGTQRAVPGIACAAEPRHTTPAMPKSI